MRGEKVMSKEDALIIRLNEHAAICMAIGMDIEVIIDAIQYIQEHEGAES